MASEILWDYRCFVTLRGIDVIDAWHGKISKKAKGKFDRKLEQLCAQEKTEWKRPHACPLGNNIYVIHFNDETNMQHRISGHFDDANKAFILTVPGYEKDNEYHPSDYKKRATANKSECDNAYDARTKECFVLAPHRTRNDLSKTKSAEPAARLSSTLAPRRG